MGDVVFKDVAGFPGYRVGNDGSVWSCRKTGCKPGLSNHWKQMKPAIIKGGYQIVGLSVGKKGQECFFLVHRLILENFCGPCPAGFEACHNDGNPSNNNLSNLRWGTKSENSQDRYKHGTDQQGEKNHRAKLTVHDVLRIVQMRDCGCTQKEIAKLFSVHQTRISAILLGKTWSHLTKIENPKGLMA